MTFINTITDNPVQSMTLKISTGDSVDFGFRFMPNNKGWYFSITYGTFSLFNRRVVTGVNMLRGFRNLLPFGFACTTKDNYEPMFLDDFSSGRANFYLLDTADMSDVESILQQEQVILG